MRREARIRDESADEPFSGAGSGGTAGVTRKVGQRRYNSVRSSPHASDKKVCPNCRKRFAAIRPHQIFDKDACRGAYWRKQQAKAEAAS